MTYTFILLKSKWFYLYEKIQMPIVKTLPSSDKEELRDHRDNTAKDLVKTYSLRQLSFMDWVDTRTIKKSWRYLPVRIDTADSLYRFKRWEKSKPYMIRYIRLDEIKSIFNKRTKKKLSVD